MRRTAALLLGLIASLAAFAGGPQYALHVKGLACPFCAYGIEKHLSRIEGVDAIAVDIETGRVLVTMAEGATLSRERAGKAVDAAGFTLGSFTRTESGDGG